MKLRQKKELLRERTAYRVGRAAVDLFIILELVGVVIASIPFIRDELLQPRDQIEVRVIGIAGLAAVAAFIVAIAQRELLQALFDIADSAVRRTEIDLTELD